MENFKLRVSLKAVARDDKGNVLIVDNSNGENDIWSYPGGGIEEGETFEQTLRRELVEETGLPIQVGKIVFIQDMTFKNGNRQIEIFFYCKIIGIPTAHNLPPERNFRLVNETEFSKMKVLPSAIKPFGIMSSIDYSRNIEKKCS